MTSSCERTALRRFALAAAISLACLAGFSDLPNSACKAAEPGLLPKLETSERSDGAVIAGPLLKAAEANTPARLDDEAASASQPISPRPLMCCRPAPSAAQNARSGAQVHPTLAALAEAVRPRRKSSPAPMAEPARQPVAPQVTEATEPAAEPIAPASENSEPQPLRNDSLEFRSPLAAPAEPQVEPQPKPDGHSPPLTITNPWAARLAPVAPKEQAPPPAREAVKEPIAEPTRQQRAWKSAEPKPVRLARYHRPEAQGQATVSLSPAPVDRAVDAERILPEVSTDENPLRGRDASRNPRPGAWSSAVGNPLR